MLDSRLIHFAGIAAAIAVTPIPIADIYILSVLQGILVVFITTLNYSKLNFAYSGTITDAVIANTRIAPI